MGILASKLFLVFIVGGLILLGIAVGVIRNFLKNRAPDNSKLQGDIKLMRIEIKPWVKELAPVDEDGLTLLSLSQVNQVLKKGLNKSAKGIYTSIYQEPLLAYSYKEYLGNNALLYARTAEHELVYQIKKDETRIAINGSFFGVLKKDGKLYNGETVLGQVDKADADLHLPIKVGKRNLAALNNPALVDAPQPRVFQYVENNINAEEEKTLMALATLKLIQQMVEQ